MHIYVLYLYTYMYIFESVIQVEKQKTMPLDSSLCHPCLIVNTNKNK